MATLGNAPHTPFPGVVPGTIESEMAQVMAQLDAEIEALSAAPPPGAVLDPQSLRDAITALTLLLEERLGL